MVLFNYATKEITAKIVYYGPGLCGKTTNLQFVYESLPSNSKSKMLSLATKTDRTLFFDFLPLDLGKIRGMRTKLQVYTVPGQVYYNSTRQLVLKGADGIVFVADSQDHAMDANIESLQNLEDNLKRQGMRIRDMPLVLQYNKRDLPNAMPVSQLEDGLNKFKAPHFESVATTGIGVEATLKGITQLVLTHLIKKYGLEGNEPLEREIQVLNAPPPETPENAVWEEGDETIPASARVSPFGEPEFEIDEGADAEAAPLVPTELVARPLERNPFDQEETRTEVPLTSIEVPLPEEIFDSRGTVAATLAAPLPAAPPVERPAMPPIERRSTDGLVKEVTVPLNLSLEELRQHRRLRLKITLDVNLLP